MTELSILFEHRDFLAIDKPAGMSFHNEAEAPGVASLLNERQSANLWPVHRLDKITSGILLFAKNKKSSSKLSTLFYDRKIQKTYMALSDQKPKKKQGFIKGDMQKTRNGSWKLCNTLDNPAITQFHSKSLVPSVRLYWLQPGSGKTHQIRVALKSIGAPILGDSRYGGSLADRAYLHAYSLAFKWGEEPIQLKCIPNRGEYFLLPELEDCIRHFEKKDALKQKVG